eukprot:CAMPEP_0113854786 /NCGR_PEP_ID=MMETSP0372-20130328/7665_1 /TAXON_ID=340204 /ORGANISM="Lankesteria abbotti" /LENGTH=76 /DNA_ID=CAMNT_0000828297 /DNA_START=50 /DNA_END=277 /DNA_ORIENTATION=- /assembly_acc=CAM_ASM_000359
MLNVHLTNISLDDPEKYPHLLSVQNCFVRGSSIRYVHINPTDTDLDLLQEACCKEAKQPLAVGDVDRPRKRPAQSD